MTTPPSSHPPPKIDQLREYLLELETFLRSNGTRAKDPAMKKEWTMIRDDKKTRLYLNKRNGAAAALYPRFPGSPETAFALFYDDVVNKRIEPMINEIDLIHRYDDRNAVYRLSIHPIQFIISARDVVYHDYSTYDAKEDAWISVGTSVEHERAPLVPGIVRAHQRLGGMIARHHQKIEEDDEDGESTSTSSVLMYLDLDAVLPSGVPTFLRNKIDYLGAMSLGDGLVGLGRMAMERPIPIDSREIARLKAIRRTHKSARREEERRVVVVEEEAGEKAGAASASASARTALKRFVIGFVLGCVLEFGRGYVL